MGDEVCWQLNVDGEKSAQSSDLMMMFENLLGTVFCQEIDSETKDNGSEEVPQDLGAIDDKIKAALQMMKASLSFGVGEEVESLKAKVVDLEMKIDELKSENRFLREYAPEEILKQIEERLMSPSLRSPMEKKAPGIET